MKSLSANYNFGKKTTRRKTTSFWNRILQLTVMKFNFDVEKVLDEVDENLEIFCRLIFKGRDLASKIDSYIFVRTTGARR